MLKTIQMKDENGSFVGFVLTDSGYEIISNEDLKELISILEKSETFKKFKFTLQELQENQFIVENNENNDFLELFHEHVVEKLIVPQLMNGPTIRHRVLKIKCENSDENLLTCKLKYAELGEFNNFKTSMSQLKSTLV